MKNEGQDEIAATRTEKLKSPLYFSIFTLVKYFQHNSEKSLLLFCSLDFMFNYRKNTAVNADRISIHQENLTVATTSILCLTQF